MSESWQIIEALLFASPEVVSTSRLGKAADLTDSEVEACISKLNSDYETQSRAFHIRKVAGGWQMVSRVSFAPWIGRLVSRRGRDRLSKAALETLAVIAHRQPINKPDIDQARGIESSYILAHLLERGLVRIKGRDKRAGHPYVYATTPKFLEYFGLASLEELPDLEEPAIREEDIMPLEEGEEARAFQVGIPPEGEHGDESEEDVSPQTLAAIGYRIESEEADETDEDLSRDSLRNEREES